jgi:hypothetical protein
MDVHGKEFQAALDSLADFSTSPPTHIEGSDKAFSLLDACSKQQQTVATLINSISLEMRKSDICEQDLYKLKQLAEFLVQHESKLESHQSALTREIHTIATTSGISKSKEKPVKISQTDVENISANSDVSTALKQAKNLHTTELAKLQKQLGTYRDGSLANEKNIKYIADQLNSALYKSTDSSEKKEIQSLLDAAKQVQALESFETITNWYLQCTLTPPAGVDLVQQVRSLNDLLTPMKAAKEVDLLRNFVQQIACDVESGISSAINTLLRMDKETLDMLKAFQNKEKPDSTQTQLTWFTQSTALYWDLHNPFEIKIGAEIATKTILKALDERKSSSSTLLSGLDQEKIQELEKRAKLLSSAVDAVTNYAQGSISKEIIGKNPKIAVEAKAAYLKEKRKAIIAGQKPSVQVNIIGGGPGGLTRALVAGIKGENATVIEKRSDYARQNVVKIHETPITQFFGIHDRLLFNNKIDDLHSNSVSIMDLEEALVEIGCEIYGDDTFKMQGEVVDILPGKANQMGCIVKTGKESTVWLPGDLFVDATGARADIAKILHVDSTLLGTQQTMVAVVLKKENQDKVATDGKKFDQAVSLSTPDYNYALIQPKIELQHKLTALTEQKSLIIAAEANLKGHLKNFQSSASPELFRKSVEECLSAKERKKLDAVTTDQKTQDATRDTSLVELAETRLKDLVKQKVKVEKQSYKLLRSIVKEQQGKKIAQDTIENLASFSIMLSQRNTPSVLFGNSLIMFAGDALVTPDPKSAAGANHAIQGSASFALALDGKKKKLPLTQLQHYFSHSSRMQMNQVTEQGLGSRAYLDPHTATETTAFYLKTAVEKEWIAPKDMQFLERTFTKLQHGLHLSAEDQTKLFTVSENIKKFAPKQKDDQKYLAGLQRVIWEAMQPSASI